MGISRVSDALQAHMWPKMEMAKNKRDSQSGRDKAETDSGKAAAGDDGETEVKEKKSIAREGLRDLEAKVTASSTTSKEVSKSKVGKISMMCSLCTLDVSLSLSLSLSLSRSLPLLFPPTFLPCSLPPPFLLSPPSLFTDSNLDGLLSEEERLIAEGLDGEKDPGGESFESLFARFAQMKRKLNHMML